MFKELFNEAKTDLGEFTAKNHSDIENKVQRLTRESRMYLEDHFKSGDDYLLLFGSKKSYAANSWDNARRSIENYIKNLYSAKKVQANEAPEENEYEWSVSVRITT